MYFPHTYLHMQNQIPTVFHGTVPRFTDKPKNVVLDLQYITVTLCSKEFCI